MTAIDRTTRLSELRAEEAKRLNLDVNAGVVTRIAALKLQHEILLSRMCNGETVASAELIEVSKAIEELSPTPAPALTVDFVNATDYVCQRCHGVMSEEQHVAANARIAHRRADGRDKAPAPAISDRQNDTAASEADAVQRAPASNVVPIAPKKRTNIHDAAESSGIVKSDVGFGSAFQAGANYSNMGGFRKRDFSDGFDPTQGGAVDGR
jgi:hypothetical protein